MTSNILPFTEPAAAKYELRSWGEFSLFDHNAQRECTPRGRKACAIIAYLATVGGERVNRERLTALLWSERDEEQARASLRQTLFELKPLNSGSPGLLEIERTYVRLNPALLSSDGTRFQNDAQRDDIGALCHALTGRNGELFSGLDGLDPGFDEWLAAQRRREHERLLTLGIAVGERGLEEDNAGMVRDLVAGLQALDQTNEEVARLGMRADHACGNHAAMHRRYQQLKDELARELNVEPSAETISLVHRLTGDGHAVEDAALADYGSEWAAMTSIAAKIGCTAETLRRWCREEASPKRSWLAGPAALAGQDRDRLKLLEREVKELRRANEILRKATAYFAQAELDRQGKW